MRYDSATTAGRPGAGRIDSSAVRAVVCAAGEQRTGVSELVRGGGGGVAVGGGGNSVAKVRW